MAQKPVKPQTPPGANSPESTKQPLTDSSIASHPASRALRDRWLSRYPPGHAPFPMEGDSPEAPLTEANKPPRSKK